MRFSLDLVVSSRGLPPLEASPLAWWSSLRRPGGGLPNDNAASAVAAYAAVVLCGHSRSIGTPILPGGD